jgi:hypothetical protein
LGSTFSVEIVDSAELANGFAVLGRFRFTRPGAPGLDRQAIEAAKRRYTGKRDERATAAHNVLAILSAKCEQPGQLDALLLWEVVEALRQALEAGLSQRMLAEVAVRWGLARGDADILSMSVFEAQATASPPAAVREIEALLGEGRLRAAERVVAGLGQTGDGRVREVTERVTALAARVAASIAQAERALPAGRTEEAAQWLAEALAIVTDDPGLRARLAMIAPPPPSGLSATVEDGKVRLSWRASPVRIGQPRYRVVRRAGQAAVAAGQGTLVGETERLEIDDREPGAQDALFGQPLHYSVFAARARGAWSSPARVGPVVVAPDVTGVQLRCDATSISGSWRVPPRAAEVVVVRREGNPPATPAEGQRIPAPTRGAFTDRDVRTGARYFYRVSVVYHTLGGAIQVSPGVVVSAVPESVPAAVADLQVRLLAEDGGASGEAEWTVPRGGTVSIHVTDRPPPWAAGTEISLADLALLGRPVGPAPARAPGERARLRLGALAGRYWVTAVTGGSAYALVGNTVEVKVVAPVSGLQARRLDERVHLSWVWPPESTAALVRWRPQAGGTGGAGTLHEAGCSRRDYRAAGGFTIPVGPAPHTVAVHAVMKDTSDDTLAAPVTVAVPGLPARVWYSVQRERRRWRSQATVELRAERSCTTPPLLVVHRLGEVMPLDARQGTAIGRIEPQAVRPETPYRETFDVPAARGTSWVVCFTDGDADGVLLVPPPVSQLKAG